MGQIFVKTITSITFCLPILNNTTIIELKQMIEKEEKNFHVEQQMLIFNGTILEDSKTITELKIKSGSILYIVIKVSDQIDVFVKLISGNTIIVNTSALGSVSSLKEIIENKTGISVEQQRLLFLRKVLDDEGILDDYGIRKVLDDEGILDDYGIVNGSTIYMGPDLINLITVNIIPLGLPQFSVQIFPMDLIGAMKSKIHTHLNLCPNEQTLIFGGRQLGNNEIINDCNIFNGSCVSFVLRLVDPKNFH
jgi:ubiquitin C